MPCGPCGPSGPVAPAGPPGPVAPVSPLETNFSQSSGLALGDFVLLLRRARHTEPSWVTTSSVRYWIAVFQAPFGVSPRAAQLATTASVFTVEPVLLMATMQSVGK